jgi:hypothetical protein
MKSISAIIAAGLLGLGLSPVHASTAYGDLNNFDVVNDTGQECHGFEIELDDVHSKDITYTYDWNHYGTPRISEDSSDPLHPKVIIRYAGIYTGGSWSAYTAIPAGPIAPTQGHQFTDPSVNFGGEHFGAGFYGSPTATRYYWLVDDGSGNLVHGPLVQIATPSFVYYPPAPAVAAKVQAAIVPPAPPAPPAPPVKEFGAAMWVKEIRTTTHNANKVELRDLVSDDPNVPNDKNWRNGEPDEVEVEWQILQTDYNSGNGGANGELQGAAEDLPNGDEVVTRRYEFFKYVGPLDTETGEALGDIVGPDGIHGVGSKTAAGITYDLSMLEVVGDFIGAQMAGFAAAAPLGLIDHLQDGDLDGPYVERTVVVGGNSPYLANIVGGVLPDGMDFNPATGVLSGTPTASGQFLFTVEAMDSDGVLVTNDYTLNIVAPFVSLPPVITSVMVSGVSTTEVTVTWNTDQPSTSQIELNGVALPEDPALVTAHSVVLTGLLPSTLYHFVAVSVNEFGDGTAATDATFTTATPPPVISLVAVSGVSTMGATVTWTTDQPSSSEVVLDGVSLGVDPAFVLAHSVTITGLNASTVYHFTAQSLNASGGVAGSPDAMFTTATPLPPVISLVTVDAITTDSATINWTTDLAASSQVELDGVALPVDPSFVTMHSVVLTGLTPSTPYHFIVASVDANGGSAISMDATFITATPALPVISLVTVDAITTDSATINWTTDLAASSQVELDGVALPVDPALVTTHSVVLTGLAPSTPYHFVVVSVDANGGLVSSLDATFTTATTEPPTDVISGSGKVTKTGRDFIQLGTLRVYYNDRTVITYTDREKEKEDHKKEKREVEIEKKDLVQYTGVQNADGSVTATTLVVTRK